MHKSDTNYKLQGKRLDVQIIDRKKVCLYGSISGSQMRAMKKVDNPKANNFCSQSNCNEKCNVKNETQLVIL